MEQNDCINNTDLLPDLLSYCLSKEGAFLDFPFGPDYITVKIKRDDKSRIFAEIFVHDGEMKMTFSTDEITAQNLRSTYPDVIVKGWHCPPVHAKYKSSVIVDEITSETLKQLVDFSYVRAISKLK